MQAYDGAVTIELPDGRTLDAEVGLDVPDGSFVEVGGDGSLLLGDDELGPGHYETRDGQAIPNSSAAGTTTITTTTTTTTTTNIAPTPGATVDRVVLVRSRPREGPVREPGRLPACSTAAARRTSDAWWGIGR